MKKFFTLTLALMASFSLCWASTVGDLATISADHNVYFRDIVSAKVSEGTLFDSNYLLSLAGGNNYKTDQGTDKTVSKKYCLRVKSTSQDVIAFKVGSSCTLVMYANRIVDRTPIVNTTISSTNPITGSNVTGTDGNKGHATYSIPAAGTYYIIGNGSDCYLAGLEFSGFCTDPEATIINDAAGYVGDAIDLAYSSANTSDIVWDINKGGVATSDASISEGKFTATVAGTYVVTATQAKDGTYCEAEESVTLTIANAEKVETVTINNAAETARLNEEVELTMTAENATQYKWYVKKDAGEYAEVATTDGYTFSATEAGSYTIKCAARNDFNKDAQQNPTWVESSNTHTITVNISDDATLSALSVAGKTLTPAFAPAEVDYAVGQLDVYELLNVTATAADAPYATVEIADNKTDAVTITVTAEDESIKIYTISYTREAATELVSISESTTWDWEEAGDGTDEQKATTFPTNTEEFNFADVLIEPANTFNAAALSGIAQFAKRGGDYNCFQGTKIKFNTTVPGSITVYYQNTSNRKEDGRRWVDINGTKTGDGAIDQKAWYTVEADVNTGDVIITFEDKNAASTMLRINKIVFTEAPKYDITCNDAEHGSVSAQAQAHEDDVVTLTISPESGYKLNSLIVKDAEDADVEVANNKFTMPASNVTVTATFVEDSGTGINNTDASVKAVKVLRDGQIYIEKNGHVYNVFGACIK